MNNNKHQENRKLWQKQTDVTIPQLFERFFERTKIMAAERIQDCFWFRSLFHIRTVLTGRFRQPCDKNQTLFKITVVIIKQPERVRNWFSIIPVELNIIILNNEHVVFTFRKDARFSMVRKTHVFLSRETVTVKNIRPWVSLAGKHWGTAFPHCHTQTTAGLDETEQIATRCYTVNNGHDY